ncbi:unnamed protein product [Sphagnum jensenii]|uniref:F-box domain-containing protein n=2 Tax=Sphagnum TaxID=13804 RepID=A0ABP1B396_9BRYO
MSRRVCCCCGWRHRCCQRRQTVVAEKMFFKRRCIGGGSKQVESVEEISECMSVLDLPELALEGILVRLPAASLVHMAVVCQDLRKRCRNDHLWQHLFHQKWARIAGPSGFRKWQQHLTTSSQQAGVGAVDRSLRLWGWPLSCLWPFSWLNLQGQQPVTSPAPNSLMAWYWALESGTFWFPAQVYNQLSYDHHSDSFCARYRPHGPWTIVVEENKDFPYGWWYGVVGHVETCSWESHHCYCYLNGSLQVTAEGEGNIPTKWSVMSEVLRWDMVIPSILWEHWREEPWCHINKRYGIVLSHNVFSANNTYHNSQD